MEIKRKLVAGYLVAALLITVSGLLGLYGTEKIVTLLQGKDAHLRSIVVSCSKLTIEAKDAEADIIMYLLRGNKVFREKCLQHLRTWEMFWRHWMRRSRFLRARKYVALIKSDIMRVAPAGQSLLDAFDTDLKTNGSYVPSDHVALTEEFLR